MKRSKQIILGIISLLVIIAMTYYVGLIALRLISKVNPNIIVASIAGMVTFTGYFVTRHLERKKIIEQQIREQKLPVYEDFFEFMFGVIRSTKNGKEFSQAEAEKFMFNFNKKAMVWLSDSSIKAFDEWRESANSIDRHSDPKNDGLRQLLLLEKMFFEFRKDIGHEDKKLKQGDLLRMFINDFNTLNSNK